jgi:NADH:ubiquinone oxidoreductase subunit C
LIYVFWNLKFNTHIYIKTFTNIITPIISIESIYLSSSWLEREVWDMYGVKFLLHKNLRRILTDYGFHGYPMRKEFPLTGFIEIRYDDLYQSILVEPVEITQTFRYFKFYNPWNNWK